MVRNMGRLSMYRAGLLSWCSMPSRAQRMQDHVDVVTLAATVGGRRAEVTPENRRQRPIVGQIEIAHGRNRDVDLDRVEAGTKNAFGDAAPQDVSDQFHERAVQLPDFVGGLKVPRA